jgi:hypothetical protein
MDAQLFLFDDFSPPGLVRDNGNDDEGYARFEADGCSADAAMDDGRLKWGNSHSWLIEFTLNKCG